MKTKKLLSICAFFISALFSIKAENSNVYGKSFFLGNGGEVTSNGLMHALGKHRDILEEKANGNLSIHVEGGQTFKAQNIAQYFFFNNSDSMRVGQRATLITNDIYSINLLLPQNTVSATDEQWQATIKAAPRLSTFTADFRGIFLLRGMEKWYAEANLPVVHIKSNMRLSEQAGSQTITTIPAGYLDINANGNLTAPYTSVIAALKGDKTIGDVTAKRQYGNIDGFRKKTVIGDVRLALGRRCIDEEQGYLALAFLGLINGDDKSSSDVSYLGMPVVGTAGRNGVGIRCDGFYELYEHNDKRFSVGLRADIVHTFNAIITRSYDASKHGIGSRYLLVKEFTSAFAYNNIIKYLIDLSTLRAKINMAAVCDVSLMLRAQHKQIHCDLGLHIHAHTKETHKKWIDTGLPAGNYGALATAIADCDDALVSQDVSITGAQINRLIPSTGATASANTVLSINDLDKNSGLAPAAHSYRFFGNLGYSIDHRNDPYLLAGFSAECANINAAPAQWGAYIAGGLHF